MSAAAGDSRTTLRIDLPAHLHKCVSAKAINLLAGALTSGRCAITYCGFGSFWTRLTLLCTILRAPLADFQDSLDIRAEASKVISIPYGGRRSCGAEESMEEGLRVSCRNELESEPEHEPLRSFSSSKVRTKKTPSGSGAVHKAGHSIFSVKPVRPPFEDVALQHLVGRGSFGRVYAGTWHGASVAVKVMTWNTLAADRKCAPLFEAQLSAALSHPCLVQTFKYSSRKMVPVTNDCWDVLEEAASGNYEVWIVQEWCDRGTLSQYCNQPRSNESSIEEVCHMCSDITAAGSYLHSRGIIHADLTANNVLIKSNVSLFGYVCKVCDFGLARILEDDTKGLRIGQLGTITHMPPELFEFTKDAGEVLVTPKADVYAAGMLLWQIITGRPPWEGLTAPQVVVRIAQGARLRLPESVAANLRDVFDQCTDPEPDMRPSFKALNACFTRARSQSMTTKDVEALCDCAT